MKKGDEFVERSLPFFLLSHQSFFIEKGKSAKEDRREIDFYYVKLVVVFLCGYFFLASFVRRKRRDEKGDGHTTVRPRVSLSLRIRKKSACVLKQQRDTIVSTERKTTGAFATSTGPVTVVPLVAVSEAGR